MAYREFRNVEDTRPLPTGFEKGFNPDIPTQAEVDAIKQKQAQDAYQRAIKDPTLSFEKAIDLDREWIEPQKQNASKRFINEYLLYGKATPETEAELNKVHLNIEKGYTDLANSKSVQDSYTAIPELKDGVNTEVVKYNTTHPSERISGVQFAEGIKQRLPQLYNLNVAADNFTKTLADQESKQSNSTDVGGVLRSRESLIRSKIKDGKVTPEVLTKFYDQNPLVQQAIDYRRQASDIERVNNLKHKTGVTRKQNLDGTYTTEVITYKSPEELADAVSKGAAYPSDANGNPLKGFESGFNVEERNNQVASNYIMGAAGLSTAQETKVKVDEDKAGVRDGFGFGFNVRKNIALTKGEDSQFIQQPNLAQQLKNAGLSDDEARRAQVSSGSVLIPSVIGNGVNNNIRISLAGIPTTKDSFVTSYIGDNGKPIVVTDFARNKELKDVEVLSAEPITTNSNGNRVLIPESLKGKDRVKFLSQRTGTNNRGRLKTEVVLNLGSKGATDTEFENIPYRVSSYKDPVWLRFVESTLPANQLGKVQERARTMFNGLANSNKDAKNIEEAVSIQRKQAPIKKTTKAKSKTQL